MQTVTIIDTSGNSTQTAFRSGHSVKDILEFLGYNPDKLDVTVNGVPADMDDELSAGDRITVNAKKVTSG